MHYVMTILSPIGEEKRFVSESPFMTIAIGDSRHMMLFRDEEGLNLPLTVTNVEHMILQDNETGEITHAVHLYTKRDSMD